MDDSQSVFMRSAEVLRVLGVAKSTLWRWCQSGHFPRPVRLGEHAVAWKRGEVLDWIDDRPRA